MKCLVISFYYPPDPAIGSVRVGALVDALRSTGHEVRVVAAANPGDCACEQEAVVRATWFDVQTLRLVRRRASRSSAVVREQPRRSPDAVEVAHHVSAPDRPGRFAGASAKWLSPGSGLRRAIAGARLSLVELPDAAVGWLPGALLEARRQCRDGACDVVISSGPPFSAHVVAAVVGSLHGVPWVADYRDLWTDGTYYVAHRWRRMLDTKLEQKLLSSSAFATTVSEPLAADLRRDFGVPAEVVLNGFDPVEQDSFRVRQPLSDARLNLLYVGNNLYGGRRTPELLFRAAAEMRLSREDVRFHFLGTDPKVISDIAVAAGVDELVEVHPPTVKEESVAMQARADVLMLLMWNDPGEAGVYSGKIYEYIAVKRPIVMVGYPNGVAADLVRSRGLGWVVSSDAEARDVLGKALDAKESSALLPDLTASLSVGLERKEQAARMVTLIERAVNQFSRRRVPSPEEAPLQAKARGSE